MPALGERQDNGERSIFAVEAKRNAAHGPLSRATTALIRDQYKLIHHLGYAGYDDSYELYDLAADPEELGDIFSTRTSTAADLQHELEEKLEEANRRYMP